MVNYCRFGKMVFVGDFMSPNMRITLVAICSVFLLWPLLGADSEKHPDYFQEKSRWSGVVTNDERKAKRIEEKATLRVVERDGEKFAAEYSEHIPGGGVRSLRLEGRIKNGKIEARATKIIKGTWAGAADVVWQGEIRDKQLGLIRQNEKRLNMTTRLSLDEEKDKSKD
jgi:hypothetical protein